MKLSIAAIAIGTALLCLTATASGWAGVVITQQTTTDSPGGPQTGTHTVMIQGNQQKTVMQDRVMLLDLDSNTLVLLNTRSKTYLKLPFPPHGMAAAMQNMSGMNPALKKTGVNRTINGYKCVEYAGQGQSRMGQYSIKGCFSSIAPGAAEYDHFMARMSARLKASSVTPIPRPDGIPVSLETTTKLTSFSMPGMTPEQAAAMAKLMKNRPPTKSSIITTSIKSQKLAGATFLVPTDYTEQTMPAPHVEPAQPAPNKPYHGE